MESIVAKKIEDRDRQLLPWYRYGWPWFLISIPLISIGLGMSMLYLALSTNNSLVVDDYYKQGKAINQRIGRDRVAALLGINGSLSRVPEGLLLNIGKQTPAVPESLQEQAALAESDFLWPDALQIRWIHVTEAEFDGQGIMQSIGGGRYIARDLLMPSDGKFRLHLEPVSDTAWRLVSDIAALPIDQMQISAPLLERVFRTSELK